MKILSVFINSSQVTTKRAGKLLRGRRLPDDVVTPRCRASGREGNKGANIM